MNKIWQSKKSIPLDKTIEKFTVGPDLEMDAKLVEYDVLASTAHAAMLSKMGHLKNSDLNSEDENLDIFTGKETPEKIETCYTCGKKFDMNKEEGARIFRIKKPI